MRVILGFFLFLLMGCQQPTVLNTEEVPDIKISVLMLDQETQYFSFPSGSTVGDLLKVIECQTCDLSRLNPNQMLYPNDHIVLYPKGMDCISINTSTLDELDQLPGVGPILAQRILDYRLEFGLFQRIEDLMQVKGIKEKLFEKVKDVICLCVKPSTYFPF